MKRKSELNISEIQEMDIELSESENTSIKKKMLI